MRVQVPFFWQPSGVVSSVADLTVSDAVPAKKDVTALIRQTISDPHPLLVAELAGGKIIGDLRLAATRDDVVVGGMQLVSGCQNFDELKNHHTLRRRRFRIPRYRRGTALLLGAANSDNYYHWLLETLPRWRLLQAAGYRACDFILLHSRPQPFQTETLVRMDLPPAKILRPSKNFVHQFDRLVVPAMPFPLRQVAAWACEYVRILFPERGGGPEKIFLTRHGVRRRRLVNERELEMRLNTLGFVSVQPEHLPVAEQARLFGSAKYIVAAHGAGLANLAFAPANSTLVELFHPDVIRPTYKNLAIACGLRHTGVVGHRVNVPDERDAEKTAFTIDVKAVIQALAATL
jgi:capsular polysaccharide biosynthesis protein